MLPISDEQAKLGRELVKTARETSAWLSDTAGDLPKDAVGMLGDWVKVKRAELRIRCVEGARERLRARGIASPSEPNPKILLPLLEAAENEDNETLHDLWARLLATAMDPNRKSAVRQAFVATIQQFDPLDALVIREIHRNGNGGWEPHGKQVIASRLGSEENEIVVSFQNLAKLDCISFTDSTGPRMQPYLTAFGQVLMKAVSD